jgi:hypothetical protein
MKQRDFVNIEAASINIIKAKETHKKERQKREEESIKRNKKATEITQLQHSIT